MNDVWRTELTRFHGDRTIEAWPPGGDGYDATTFGVCVLSRQMNAAEYTAQVEACRLNDDALTELEANVGAFLAASQNVDDLIRRWGAAVQLIEIVRRKLAAEQRPPSPSFDRLRFLLMAYPADVGVYALPAGEHDRDNRLFDALKLWLQSLDRYEDEDVFADWTAERIDREYGYVAARLAVQNGLSRPRPGVLQNIISGFCAQHLLPRYDLKHTWAMSDRLFRRWTRSISVVMVTLLLAVPVALRWPKGSPHSHLGLAAAGAALTLATLVVAAVKASPLVTNVFCLRLPAGAAVGMVAVLSTNHILLVTPTLWQILAPVCGLFGYVVFEARQHNARSAVRSAGIVTLLGLLYGMAIASITLLR